MTYDDLMDATPRERRIARWLAGGIHLAFVLLLVLGVTWQQQPSAPAVADLWSSLPPVRQEVPPPPAPPKVEPKPEPKPKPPEPKPPEPKPEPKPPEKPKAEPKPPPPKPEVKPEPKPDIALREKLEKEKKLKEQKELELKKKEEEKRKLAQELERKKEEEKRKQALEEERKKAEVKRKEDALRKLEEEQRAAEKRLQQERQAIADRLAKEQAAAQNALLDKYKLLIRNQVRRHIIEPPNLQGNPEVEFDVVLIPGGEVLSVRLRRSSGNAAYDSAVERAIVKASPLPLPPDPAMFQQFRELNLRIRPKE